MMILKLVKIKSCLAMRQNAYGNNKFIPILQNINPRQKLYCYAFIKPHFMTKLRLKNNQYYETKIAFCFITKFPFRNFFFQSAIKLILKQLKFGYLKYQLQLGLQLLQPILSEIYSYKISHFPINFTIKNKLGEAILNIESKQKLFQENVRYFTEYLNSLENSFISRFLHYYLIQSHMLILCQNQQRLNYFLELIRIMIDPLQWPFPIIYSFTQDLVGFLQSPIPIIIGINKNIQYLEKKNWDCSAFLVIDITAQKVRNLKSNHKALSSSIQLLANKLQKKSKIQFINKFVNSKLHLFKNSINKNQFSQFETQFSQTQMVSDFLAK